MNIDLKAQLVRAINNVLDKNGEEQYWDGFIHDSLTNEMVDAAEAVFDASMNSQRFYKNEIE